MLLRLLLQNSGTQRVVVDQIIDRSPGLLHSQERQPSYDRGVIAPISLVALSSTYMHIERAFVSRSTRGGSTYEYDPFVAVLEPKHTRLPYDVSDGGTASGMFTYADVAGIYHDDVMPRAAAFLGEVREDVHAIRAGEYTAERAKQRASLVTDALGKIADVLSSEHHFSPERCVGDYDMAAKIAGGDLSAIGKLADGSLTRELGRVPRGEYRSRRRNNQFGWVSSAGPNNWMESDSTVAGAMGTRAGEELYARIAATFRTAPGIEIAYAKNHGRAGLPAEGTVEWGMFNLRRWYGDTKHRVAHAAGEAAATAFERQHDAPAEYAQTEAYQKSLRAAYNEAYAASMQSQIEQTARQRQQQSGSDAMGELLDDEL